MHPFEHYCNFGWKDGKDPSINFNSKKYCDSYSVRENFKNNPLQHFISKGFKGGLQYWPSEEYSYNICEEKTVLIIENSNDFATMRYRSHQLLKNVDKRKINIITKTSNTIKHDTLVHDLYAIVLIRIPHDLQYIESLRRRAANFGVPVIYDIDDYIWEELNLCGMRACYRKDPAKLKRTVKMIQNVRASMDSADALLTTTWPLKKLASGFGKPVQIVPNSIPRDHIALERRYENKIFSLDVEEFPIINTVVIGYFSGTQTHEYDLLECLEAVCEILQQRENIILRLFGEIQVDRTVFKDILDKIEFKPLISYEEMLSEISKCDIVIAPLETRNIFCDCKSELKIFEPALFSIPVICSPSFTYASAIVDGENGFLAANKNEWLEKLLLLIDDESLRKKIGKNASTTITPRFDTENALDIYVNYVCNIRSILDNHKKLISYQAPSVKKLPQDPLISLVTCVYNKSKELPEFLRSIQEQDFDRHAQIVFVDDCSTDNSVSIIQNWMKYIRYSSLNDWIHPILLTTESNKGNCVGRNIGILAAHADIVSIVDSDCVLSENYLSEHYNAHSTGCGDVCIGNRGIETHGKPANVIASRYAFNHTEAIQDARHQDFFLLSDFVNCVTRNFSFNKAKYPLLFDEDYTYTLRKESGFGWEDIDLGARLFAAGARTVFLEHCFTLHVTHESLCDDREKALKSLKNFHRLLCKNPFLLNEQIRWVTSTFEAIQSWLLKYTYPVSEIQEFVDLEQKIKRVKASPLIQAKRKRLRILSHAWHTSHQYELCKTQYDFYYAYNNSYNWNYIFRPLPGNVKKFIHVDNINYRDYDLIIGHFDENVLFPEHCRGVVSDSWGYVFKTLASFRDTLPMICVCHGTPQFYNQYDPFYNPDGQIAVMENSRNELRDFIGTTPVVVNSYQAKEEWEFTNAHVVWHGFQPSEFFPRDKKNIWLCMPHEKMRHRPVYNGFTLFMECMKTPVSMRISDAVVDEASVPLAEYADPQLWAKAVFARYREKVAANWFYLNFTRRSPMPRMRGESMMSGVIPVTTPDHDANLFVRHGDNGFLFDSAQEFTEVVHYIQKNEAKWPAWSARARETACDVFHIDRYLNDWISLIQKIV